MFSEQQADAPWSQYPSCPKDSAFLQQSIHAWQCSWRYDLRLFCCCKVIHELCYCFKRNLLFEIHSKPDKVDCLVVDTRVVSVIVVAIAAVNVCAAVAVVAIAVVVSDIDTDIIVAVATVFVVNIVAVAIPADTTGIVVATVVVNTVVAIFVKD